MQAIQTKYLPATNFKPSRIKAECSRGSIIVSKDYGLTDEQEHVAAAQALVNKFAEEDKIKYGTEKNPLLRQRFCGCLKNNTYVHVFQNT